MAERRSWHRKLAAVVCFLLLIAGAVRVLAQTAAATLAVSARVVTSTAILFDADGTARIITANGPDGLSVRTVKWSQVGSQLALAESPSLTLPRAASEPSVAAAASPPMPDRLPDTLTAQQDKTKGKTRSGGRVSAVARAR